MRSFLITVACLAALGGGVLLAYVAVQHPFEFGRALDTGAASTGSFGSLATSANSIVASFASSVVSGHESTSAPATNYPAHPNWTWQTTDGKTYENVVITNLNSTEVTISHSGGIAHVPLNTLPADVLSEINSAGAPNAATSRP